MILISKFQINNIETLNRSGREITMTRDGRRRTGGWAESRNNSLKSGSVEKSEHSDEDDLPVIPDLEEAEKEDFAQRVADAPNVAVNRVDTYKELDSDLFKHAAFATLEEVMYLLLLFLFIHMRG